MSIKNAKPIQIIQNVMTNDYVRNDSWLMEELQAVLTRLQDDTFKVAVVGEFSSGKSTFLNALIGKDILKHGVKETTATITEIVNDIHEGKTHEGKTEVYFTDGTVKKLLSYKNLDIGKYTTTDKSEFDVATQIDRVVIHKKVLPTTQTVVFIDTPGLNGIADHHRDKTINIIKNAHACIYLLQKRGLSESDIAFIKLLSRYQSDFIFVQNFIDTLLEAEGETADQKIAGQKAILDTVFAGQKNVRYIVCGVSALQALQAADPGVRETPLSDAAVKRLQRESRMDEVRQTIKNLMDANQKNQRQQKAAIAVAIQRLSASADTLAEQKNLAELDWQQSQAGQSEAKRNEFIKLLENKRSEHQRKIRNFVTSEASKINRQANQDIDEAIDKLLAKFTKKINSFSSSEDIDRYVKNRVFESEVNRDIDSMSEQIENYINNGYAHLHDNAILRVKQYASSAFDKDVTVSDFSKQKLNSSFQFRDNSGIQGIENDLEEARQDEQKASRDVSKQQQKVNDSIRQINWVQDEKGRLNDSYDREKARLGSRPQARTKYRTETYYRDRKGIMGSIWGFFAGQKEDTREVAYTDDSAGQEWDRRNANSYNNYSNQWDNLDYREQQYRRQLDQADNKLRQAGNRKSAATEKVQYLQTKLRAKIKQNEEAKRMAKAEYLSSQKRELQRSLQDYGEKAKMNLTRSIEGMAREYVEFISTQAIRFYTQLLDSRIENLRRMDDTTEEKEHIQRYEQNKVKINMAIRELEAYV